LFSVSSQFIAVSDTALAFAEGADQLLQPLPGAVPQDGV
jgi:hypothetical protein